MRAHMRPSFFVEVSDRRAILWLIDGAGRPSVSPELFALSEGGESKAKQKQDKDESSPLGSK